LLNSENLAGPGSLPHTLCVTTHKDSEKMWSGYAENHKGIALRIEANVAKDSKFQLFRKVTYREKSITNS